MVRYPLWSERGLSQLPWRYASKSSVWFIERVVGEKIQFKKRDICFIIKRWRSKNGEGEERDRLKRKGALKGEALSYHGTISSVIRTGSLTASLALCFIIKRCLLKIGAGKEKQKKLRKGGIERRRIVLPWNDILCDQNGVPNSFPGALLHNQALAFEQRVWIVQCRHLVAEFDHAFSVTQKKNN